MVDLQELAAPAEATPPEDIIALCRLCLRHDKPIVNIFKEEKEAATDKAPTCDSATNAADDEAIKMPMVERLYDLLKIKFQYSASLPSNICQSCFTMLEAFSNFRENVQRCETELQRWLEDEKKRSSESQRPGLNGNPGEFEPEEDSIITEVDPNQDYESSEDEFSMGSDTEIEEQSETTPTKAAVTDEQTNAVDSEFMMPAAPPAVSNAEMLHNDKMQEQAASPSPTFQAQQQSVLTNSGDTFIAGEILVRNTYLCQICDMAFTTQPECQEHEAQHDKVAPYICTFCAQRTSSRQNLIYHIKELHDPERPYVCVCCKKGFVRRSDLKKHAIVHTGVRPYACPVCGKSFSRNTNLTKHIRIHNSIKPHVCSYCPRSFSSAIDLLRHVRTHTSSRPYQCTRCPSTFARQDKLQLHEEAHCRRDAEMLVAGNGMQPPPPLPPNIKNEDGSVNTGQTENFVVPLNPYSAETADSMQAPPTGFPSPQDPYRAQQQQQQRSVLPKPPPHKPTHSRNFNCSICQKSFTRERDLQRHQALHLDTLFTCKQCGKGFNRREKLARHELEFHAPQYPCDLCRVQFSKREEFEMHMKMHELQQNAVMATQAAISAAAGMVFGSGLGAAAVDGVLGLTGGGGVPNTSGPLNLATNASSSITGAQPPPPPPPSMPLPKDMSTTTQRPSAADMSFYSQLVPTMNLGFYNETRPEDRNGI